MEPGSQTFIDVEKEQYTRQQERLARSRADVVVERVPVEKLLHESGAFVGIDLGTTNSCIAYIDPTTTQPQIIPSPSGSWVFPTCVTFDKDHNQAHLRRRGSCFVAYQSCNDTCERQALNRAQGWRASAGN